MLNRDGSFNRLMREAAMSMNRRPISVSIISWYLIVTCGLGALGAPFLLNEPVSRKLLGATGASPVAALLFSVAGGIVLVTAGVAMLKGRNWGRTLYLFAIPVNTVLSLGLYGTKLIVFNIIGLILYGVILFFLTRRPVSGYFSGSTDAAVLSTDVGAAPGVLEALTGRRIAGALLLIPGGFILNGWFMMIVPMSATGVGIIIVSGIFGFLASVFIVPAIFLWGWRQWAGVLGTLLLGVGGLLLMSGAIFYQLPSMEEFHEQFAKIDPAFMGQMAQGSLMFGIGSLVVGGLLILLQRVNRKEKAVA
jgi:hypothetical protein